MPIAARLTRKLHEVFGQEAAEAMVDWMQRVDSSRDDLRELNDLSFARFDARLGERIAETEARLDVKIAQLDAKLDAKLGALDAKLDGRVEALSASVDARIAELRLEMHSGFARMETLMERHKVELTRWALGFWLASLVSLAGTLAALNRHP